LPLNFPLSQALLIGTFIFRDHIMYVAHGPNNKWLGCFSTFEAIILTPPLIICAAVLLFMLVITLVTFVTTFWAPFAWIHITAILIIVDALVVVVSLGLVYLLGLYSLSDSVVEGLKYFQSTLGGTIEESEEAQKAAEGASNDSTISVPVIFEGFIFLGIPVLQHISLLSTAGFLLYYHGDWMLLHTELFNDLAGVSVRLPNFTQFFERLMSLDFSLNLEDVFDVSFIVSVLLTVAQVGRTPLMWLFDCIHCLGRHC